MTRTLLFYTLLIWSCVYCIAAAICCTTHILINMSTYGITRACNLSVGITSSSHKAHTCSVIIRFSLHHIVFTLHLRLYNMSRAHKKHLTHLNLFFVPKNIIGFSIQKLITVFLQHCQLSTIFIFLCLPRSTNNPFTNKIIYSYYWLTVSELIAKFRNTNEYIILYI